MSKDSEMVVAQSRRNLRGMPALSSLDLAGHILPSGQTLSAASRWFSPPGHTGQTWGRVGILNPLFFAQPRSL